MMQRARCAEARDRAALDHFTILRKWSGPIYDIP
jgi:hypothetical protein